MSHLPEGSNDSSRPPAAAGSSAFGTAYPSRSAGSQTWPAPISGKVPQTHASLSPSAAAPRLSLAHVLRFDLTKEWVYRQWERKSTGLADAELFGIRVPLVTGTGIGDLAGSLTYYFNVQGQVQHITFRGQTGDTTPLIEFLTRYYAFQRRVAPAGEQLYQVSGGDRVQSELRTRPEPILKAAAPHGSFAVELELERPGSDRFMLPHGPGVAVPQVAVAQ
jgi:hypothetical protein